MTVRNIYPKGPLPKLELASIEVWHHDSLMAATHNMPCAVCSSKGAVLFLNTGKFRPCDECRGKGWRTVKLNRFWLWVLRIAGMDV